MTKDFWVLDEYITGYYAGDKERLKKRRTYLSEEAYKKYLTYHCAFAKQMPYTTRLVGYKTGEEIFNGTFGGKK